MLGNNYSREKGKTQVGTRLIASNLLLQPPGRAQSIAPTVHRPMVKSHYPYDAHEQFMLVMPSCGNEIDRVQFTATLWRG
ncbi:MAG TPA: hypothetical protein VKY19_13730 [Ktedonosporobacter sp.]|nr:hypothetical protein [Ktedonosporobacter sp.]